MNKENLGIFSQLISGKQIVIGKPRQVVKTYSTQLFRDWKVTFDRYSRAQYRKESIKKLFNI